MRELFGVTVHSLSTVAAYLKARVGDNQVKLVRNDWKPAYKTAKILLIPNVNTLKNKIIRKHLNTYKGVCVVFDSPPSLYNIPKLTWLDVKRNADCLSYKFEFVPINYKLVEQSLKNKSNTKTVKVKSTDILANLVNDRQDTEFLKLLHEYLYFCTSHANRELCKKTIVNGLTKGEYTNKLRANLRTHCISDASLPWLDSFIAYLDTDEGKKLIKCARICTEKGMSIYKKKAEKMKVPVADMKWVAQTIKSLKDTIKFE